MAKRKPSRSKQVVVGQVVWRGELSKVYLDPPTAEILCYIREQHASPRCERALRGGTPMVAADPKTPWCDLCTTADRAQATKRLNADGEWVAA